MICVVIVGKIFFGSYSHIFDSTKKMSNPDYVFEPTQGAVQWVRYAHNGVHDVAIVFEVLGNLRFIIVYGWSDEGWLLTDSYEMGFLAVYEGDVPNLQGVQIDIGQSVTGGHGVILTVERVGNDLAFTRFEVDHYGFWFVLDEFLLFTEAEEGTMQHLMV